jgi:hypothetical protein
MASSAAPRRRRRSRVVDGLLLVPAFAVGVLLLAVFVADRTGASLSEVLEPGSVVDLVPAAFSSETP